MKKLLAGVAGAICIGVFAPVAQAAPFGAVGNALDTGAASEIIQVHGKHKSCRRDRYGWHRSTVWGRLSCVPEWRKRHHRHHRHHRYWKKRR